jgi:hypothetical protein
VKKEERTRETLRLWQQRPEDKRASNDVLAFYGWLAQNRPELLDSWRYGDPYQGLKVTLRGHIREPR